jgi:hypothetical protein
LSVWSAFASCIRNLDMQLTCMRAGRVAQAMVMMGCYDLQCTCTDVCMLQPHCTRHAKHDVSVDMDAVGHGKTSCMY